MFPSPYLVFTIQLVVHICWKKYLLDLQEAISREACVSMRSWGKLWVSQNHSSLFDVPRKTQNGLMCRANCKMAWCGAQIISGHYSAHTYNIQFCFARRVILRAKCDFALYWQICGMCVVATMLFVQDNRFRIMLNPTILRSLSPQSKTTYYVGKNS